MTGSVRGVAAAGAAALFLTICAAPGAHAQDGPTLADREAIEDTMFRYSRGLDGGDPDLYTSAWAEDGEFIANGQVAYKGHEALAEVVTGVVERREAAIAAGEPARQLFHMDANVSVEFLGPDHALHRAYFFTIARTGEGAGATNEIIATGSTIDELRKIDGQWLIVKRTVANGPAQ